MRTGALQLLALASGAWARIQYVGIAIPGVDFGCDIDGKCPAKTDSFPLSEYGGGDGAGQMKHFADNNDMNVFRLSATWQYLMNGEVAGKLDAENFGHYDKLVQVCLGTGAHCMIDMHNFARHDGGIIGQGGPSDEVFVDLWVQIAKKYADNDRVIFGLMNEPHDLDIKLWAQTCQKVVTGIRKAGAETHMILLPGTNFASAETFVSTGSAEALAAITNPDGSTDGLLLDLHKYLDINNSGTHAECTTDNVEGFKTIATWLKKNNRQAMVSETGASMDESCMVKFCAQNEFIAKNTDVFIGFVGWGAGSFDSSYVLTLTPSKGANGKYINNKLLEECIIKPFIEDASPPTSTRTRKTRPTASATSTTSSSETGTSSAGASATPTRDPSSDASSSEKDDSSDSAANTRGVAALVGAALFAGAALFNVL